MLKWLLPILVLAAAGLGYVYAYYPLAAFNLVTPKDDSKRIARDISFGPDPRLVLDVYAPSQGAGPFPTVIFVHGGSWTFGTKDPYEFLGRALAAQGYVVFLPQYRLHPEHRYPVFVEDTALAMDWVTRHAGDYGGDAKKIFVTGHSAGAYNIALAILDKHYLAALGTDTSVIKGVAMLAGPSDFLPLDSPISIDVFKDVADLPATQPITFARADAPPFLIMHGTADETCKPKNSVNFHRRLTEVGGKAELKLYEGVNHVDIMLALSRPLRGRAPSLKDMTAFFKANLR